MPENPSVAPHAPVIFQEKLRPNWAIWLVALGLGATAGVAFFPIGAQWGITAGLIAFALIAFAFIANTPTIEVTADTVRVGRASIERQYVGEVTGYRGSAAYHQRGPGLNGIAFMNIRGWIDPVVRIEITDERDATPYWLTSTRRPEELTAALGGVMSQFREVEETQDQASESPADSE
ncbi:hypothetical protein CQ018_00545 [Arthrobacter sp. MYb227]|uniref:DUF3093 domain-containing protein n=1 Tax=Arthrobacter sp. MYb227 TaxID=1848601 RepID=UPI000CFC5AFF|nr:DUF3093 domain-containing protein [Arthrobacter sp. MYb227]PQZ96441.1 hypothetical protein CQ018_00545 [Arthrobacter sp. MYb227]